MSAKPKKIPYFDGKKLIYTYEYRGFKYTKEYKNLFKNYGLKVSKIIDNYLDLDINKITLEDAEYIYTIEFKWDNLECTIINSKNKKNYLV